MEAQEIAIVGLALVGFALISRRIEHWPISMPMVFVGAGALASSTGVVEVIAELEGVALLAEVTLAVILFSDAVRIDLRSLRGYIPLPARLLLIGLPLTILFGIAVNSLLLTGVAIAEIALLTAILSPTDAALGAAVVEDKSVPLRERITLNVESGLNDGMVAPLVAILLSVVAGENRSAASWTVFVIEQIGYGVLIGVACGAGIVLALRWTRANGWSDGRYEQIATFAVPIIALTGAEAIGGNGFIAAFVAGLTFGSAHTDRITTMEAAEESEHLAEFTEDAAQMLGMVMFFVFGNVYVGEALGTFGPTEYVVSIFALTLMRMIPVSLSLIGTGLHWPTRAFVGWFGPRGLASISFALLLLEDIDALGPNADDIVGVITLTVTASVLLHGLSAAPLAQVYGRWAAGADMSDEEHDAMHMTGLDPEAVPRARWGDRTGSSPAGTASDVE